MESKLQKDTSTLEASIKELNDTPNRTITRDELYQILFKWNADLAQGRK